MSGEPIIRGANQLPKPPIRIFSLLIATCVVNTGGRVSSVPTKLARWVRTDLSLPSSTLSTTISSRRFGTHLAAANARAVGSLTCDAIYA